MVLGLTVKLKESGLQFVNMFWECINKVGIWA